MTSLEELGPSAEAGVGTWGSLSSGDGICWFPEKN